MVDVYPRPPDEPGGGLLPEAEFWRTVYGSLENLAGGAEHFLKKLNPYPHGLNRGNVPGGPLRPLIADEDAGPNAARDAWETLMPLVDAATLKPEVVAAALVKISKMNEPDQRRVQTDVAFASASLGL
jgi:hypothetical protein